MVTVTVTVRARARAGAIVRARATVRVRVCRVTCESSCPAATASAYSRGWAQL